MEELRIEGTQEQPTVKFETNGHLSISGKSRPEDASAFFAPLQEWIIQCSEENEKMILKLHLSYFNSSSAKQILKIFYLLEDLASEGKDVSVLWLYDENDIMMKERGEELDSIVDLPFEIRLNK